MSNPSIRSALLSDLPAVEEIENCCFSVSRRSSRRALRHSLISKTQSVWLSTTCVDGVEKVSGAMVLYHHRLSIRIYSLAVLPAFRGVGAGRQLVHFAIELARQTERVSVTLEADRRDAVLTRWYEGFGFNTYRVLQDYYSVGRHAVRMRLWLKPALKGGRVRGCS
ncbi:MAG: GNAT family N-acetyltransferase [Kiritimatiellaceae bacterium]|nr:GNAT family N-acetyltransferase [Kiritimatiellaceae bacterium]